MRSNSTKCSLYKSDLLKPKKLSEYFSKDRHSGGFFPSKEYFRELEYT
ncbi:hypothetical protein LEP1GSC173_4376 [Leptospira interrogans str. HAI1594]|uniref:Uncharacterized protein n=3 Tax=Leptospira interrogans TaxID=173 RepID=M3H950_LEPIR|nr:hypothetical protein LEP1GSC009_3324 [Leptospira interrogans serovar Grippotyphosa str. Andaman]EKP21063.1 hypothetical protein LEP1GSC117_1369 [Leptospira interrogans serovar Icterohaemorrhagiae str. Verdun LP]EKP77382.1 hypothetical protein LEP1GSC173_4376 [Leptospira interrogans str. HAI1594]EKP87114.1 hypothetical protein LEP1GSC020_2855 [Leptospira interrogans serovar Grippotyphosa str. 2006006986]EKR45627.1 hypothetical protein LEP1GSC097_4561 [Leptospira interrogans serovar Grippotyph